MSGAASQRALFLDRDGVINIEKDYVHRVEDFEFVPGIFDLCACAAELGYRLVVVTNQAGIGRGYYTEADFQALTQWMLGQFRARGIEIAAVYHCPFHPTAGVGPYRQESFDRKPNPGMLLRAAADLRLDLSRSAFVGDKASDMAAGRAARVGRLLQLSGEAAVGNTAAGVREPGSGLCCGGGSATQPATQRDVILVHDLIEGALQLRCFTGRQSPDSGEVAYARKGAVD